MKMKKSQKLKIVANEVSFYTTVGQVLEGIGSSSDFNLATICALNDLKKNIENEHFIYAIGGKWNGFVIQMDLVK